MEATALSEKYIEIGVGKERHALKISDIHEIVKMQDITRLPGNGQSIKGITNLRGTVIPVVGLRELVGLSDSEHTKATRIVIVGGEKEKIGIVVDSVHRVVTFTEIQPPTPQMGETSSSFVQGIGQTPEGLVTILELKNVLSRIN